MGQIANQMLFEAIYKLKDKVKEKRRKDDLDDRERTGMEYRIRLATEKDAKEVHDIYGAYVPLDYVTFTIDNPDVESYRQKIIHTLERYPFLAAENEDGKILGYVYGSPLRPHDAYQWNVEWTIVLAPDAPRRQGIATALYEEFERILVKQGYRFIYGVLVDTNAESLAFHKSLGFSEVGHFENTGYKLGKWRGIRWMVKQIGSVEGEPGTPLKLSDVLER